MSFLHRTWMANSFYKGEHLNEVSMLWDNPQKFCESFASSHELSVSPGTSQREARKCPTLKVATSNTKRPFKKYIDDYLQLWNL